jgi:hypothetical protein
VQEQSVPEHVKRGIDQRPDHIGGDQEEKFIPVVTVIPDCQKGPQWYRQQERGGYGDAPQSVLTLDSYNPSVLFGEHPLAAGSCLGWFSRGFSESLVPPGDQSIRKKGKKIDPHDSSDVGPKERFKEAKLKLDYGQWEGHGKFYRTE